MWCKTKIREEGKEKHREKYRVHDGGGAPVTQEFADGIGASGYSSDAAAAVGLVRRLVTSG
ncbi:hypothetical protein ACFLZM_01560 [Thermodesulfobacteriota bacterium]